MTKTKDTVKLYLDSYQLLELADAVKRAINRSKPSSTHIYINQRRKALNEILDQLGVYLTLDQI